MRSQTLPACSRCHQDQLLSVANMPKTDAYGRRIQLELCKVCDTDKPAAAASTNFLTTAGGHDLSRAEEASQLMIKWTREGMAAYVWYWEDPPPPQPVLHRRGRAAQTPPW
ncbi:DUF6300 family protein [Streptomyces sp. TRM 70351]|uniref:DUF6300 family protein n=1 Tax=Streptomyces sp. TRM 70351 TaxID=3116552 RepID=UPI002E7BE754|nr:DUF6300 family protein [Streptomyces sp. TRM 70351]MEE1928784.1 DUF6300 family protein [Streptomyces sp. TRM 70351]